MLSSLFDLLPAGRIGSVRIDSTHFFCEYYFGSRDGGRRTGFMRISRLVAAACVLLVARPLFAQKEWIEYKNMDDHFAINAPGEPMVEKTSWVSEYDSKF